MFFSCWLYETLLKQALKSCPGDQTEYKIKDFTTTQNLPYDYASIMHYSHSTYSGKSELVPRNRSIPLDYISSAEEPTELDYLHINLAYCNGTEKDMQFIHSLPKHV